MSTLFICLAHESWDQLSPIYFFFLPCATWTQDRVRVPARQAACCLLRRPRPNKVPATRAKRAKRPALHCTLTPPCSPLTLPSAAARRPSPLRAPPRLLIPRCAPTAHGPASNISMPQEPSRSYRRQLLQESPTTPCVACLASLCGRGAVPLHAWPHEANEVRRRRSSTFAFSMLPYVPD